MQNISFYFDFFNDLILNIASRFVLTNFKCLNMKILKKQIRVLSLTFATLMLLQSCKVYHSKSVSLEEAVKSEKRVKIKTKENRTHKFSKLVLEEGQLYGVKIRGNQISKTPLKVQELKRIRLHNKMMSILLGITVPIITIVGLFIIALSQWSGPEIGPIQFPN